MKLNYLIALSFLLIAAGSCKKEDKKPDADYKCSSCKLTPDAIAANDASSKGIYKGVVIGSTGTISFNILNNGTSITAVMVLDGTTVNLTSSVTWTDGSAYVAPFTGTLNGSPVSISFSVSANGGNPTVTSSSIPGHPNAQFTLIKEPSVSVIEAFEGKYESSAEKGTFNILLSRSIRLWTGSHRIDGGTSSEEMDGTISADGKLLQDGTDYVGTLSGDQINGSFKDGNGRTVTVTGKRTL